MSVVIYGFIIVIIAPDAQKITFLNLQFPLKPKKKSVDVYDGLTLFPFFQIKVSTLVKVS